MNCRVDAFLLVVAHVGMWEEGGYRRHGFHVVMGFGVNVIHVHFFVVELKNSEIERVSRWKRFVYVRCSNECLAVDLELSL